MGVDRMKRELTHAFQDGSTARVTRTEGNSDASLPVIMVVCSNQRKQQGRNALGRAGQKLLLPGERLLPVRKRTREGVTTWYYVASELGRDDKDQARLDFAREHGGTRRAVGAL